MKLTKNKAILVLRVNDFENIHFIEEHQKIIKTSGSVWMLKVGRPLIQKTLNTVKVDGNYLILKEPKKAGGKYYLCHILDVFEGFAKKEFIYPSYYKKLLSTGISLNGTWLLIEGIVPIGENDLRNIVLIKGGKQMTEIVNCTRSPILLVTSTKDLEEIQGFMREEAI